MTEQKFVDEVQTLTAFVGHYCLNNKHVLEEKKLFTCKYHDREYYFDIQLCQKCLTLFEYSIEHLQNCPHEEKPKCRRCPNPCYEKREWKQMAKVMRQSGIAFGIEQIKQKVLQIFIKGENR